MGNGSHILRERAPMSSIKKLAQSSDFSHVELRGSNPFLPTMGHSNAVGLRFDYDAVSRPSRIGMEIAPNHGLFPKG